MTSISSLNLVVQQGGTIKELPGDKHQPHDPTQMAAIQDMKQKNADQSNTIQQSEDSEKITLGEKESDKKNMRKKKQPVKKKKNENDPEGPGRLLDTIA